MTKLPKELYFPLNINWDARNNKNKTIIPNNSVPLSKWLDEYLDGMGGSNYTFQNGLTENSETVELGGTLLKDTNISFQDFEFVAEDEEFYLKDKLNLSIPFLGFRCYDETNQILNLIGLQDATSAGGSQQINYITTDFVNLKQSVIQTTKDYSSLLTINLANGTYSISRVNVDGSIQIGTKDASNTSIQEISIDENGNFELLGVPEYTDDTDAGNNGLPSGKMYYNTTIGAYSKKNNNNF